MVEDVGVPLAGPKTVFTVDGWMADGWMTGWWGFAGFQCEYSQRSTITSHTMRTLLHMLMTVLALTCVFTR